MQGDGKDIGIQYTGARKPTRKREGGRKGCMVQQTSTYVSSQFAVPQWKGLKKKHIKPQPLKNKTFWCRLPHRKYTVIQEVRGPGHMQDEVLLWFPEVLLF